MTRVSWASLLGVLALVIVILVSATFVSSIFGRGYGWGMMGPGMMGGYSYAILGMLIPVLFLILFVAGVIWLVQTLARGTSSPASGGSTTEPVMDILKRRYALGEITKEQFEQVKRDLGVG